MLLDMWVFASSTQASPTTWHQVPAFNVEAIRIELFERAQRRQSYLLPIFEPASGRELTVLVFPHLTPDWVLFETPRLKSPTSL